MTVVVGIKTTRGVLLGADSQGSAGGYIGIRSDTKTFNLTPHIAIGYTSSFRMGQVLRFHMDASKLKTKNVPDLYEWAVVTFVPLVRTTLKEHGYMKVLNGEETGGNFLLAVHDRLFQVEDDLQVGETADEYDTCGSGFDIARGAIHALLDHAPKMQTKNLVRAALDAACTFNAYCGGPYTYAQTRA